MLLFNWVSSVIIALFMDIKVLMDPMVLSILYVWCQLNKDQIVNFWFGSQFKAMYLVSLVQYNPALRYLLFKKCSDFVCFVCFLFILCL